MLTTETQLCYPSAELIHSDLSSVEHYPNFDQLALLGAVSKNYKIADLLHDWIFYDSLTDRKTSKRRRRSHECHTRYILQL